MSEEKEFTLAQYKDEVRRLDPKLSADDKFFHAAVVLLAALQLGQNVRTLSKFTGYPPAFVQQIADRMRANKIWVNGKTRCNWFDEEGGGLEFWLDVAAAFDLVRRAPSNPRPRRQKGAQP